MWAWELFTVSWWVKRSLETLAKDVFGCLDGSVHTFGAPWAFLWRHLTAFCSFSERVSAAKLIFYRFSNTLEREKEVYLEYEIDLNTLELICKETIVFDMMFGGNWIIFWLQNHGLRKLLELHGRLCGAIWGLCVASWRGFQQPSQFLMDFESL